MDNIRIFSKAMANTILPESIDKDSLNLDDIGDDIQQGLSEFLDHHMSSNVEGSRRQFNYNHLNSFFDTKNFFTDKEYDIQKIKDAKELNKKTGNQLKTILGTFTVERTDTGYRVIDTYDFDPNVDPEGKPLLDDQGNPRQANYGDVFSSLWEGKFYSTARYLGGVRIPDGSRHTLDVNWDIPEGKQVTKDKYNQSVLIALGGS